MWIRRWPGGGPVVGTMPARSRWSQPIVAWVMRLTHHGRFGEVPVPYVAGRHVGWIDLRGLRLARSTVRVDVELSRHLVEVEEP